MHFHNHHNTESNTLRNITNNESTPPPQPLQPEEQAVTPQKTSHPFSPPAPPPPAKTHLSAPISWPRKHRHQVHQRQKQGEEQKVIPGDGTRRKESDNVDEPPWPDRRVHSPPPFTPFGLKLFTCQLQHTPPPPPHLPNNLPPSPTPLVLRLKLHTYTRTHHRHVAVLRWYEDTMGFFVLFYYCKLCISNVYKGGGGGGTIRNTKKKNETRLILSWNEEMKRKWFMKK